MARYNKKETTTFLDKVLPTPTSRVKIEDTVTGNSAEGSGKTKSEAEASAWNKLQQQNNKK